MSEYFDHSYTASSKGSSQDLSTVFHLCGIKLTIKSYEGKIWFHFNSIYSFDQRLSLSLEEFYSIFGRLCEIRYVESRVIQNESEDSTIQLTKYFTITIAKLKENQHISYIFEKSPYKNSVNKNKKSLELDQKQFMELIHHQSEILKFTEFLENRNQIENRNKIYNSVSQNNDMQY